MSVLEDCEKGQIATEVLGFHEQSDLYSVLGIVTSNENVDEGFRSQLLKHILEN